MTTASDKEVVANAQRKRACRVEFRAGIRERGTSYKAQASFFRCSSCRLA